MINKVNFTLPKYNYTPVLSNNNKQENSENRTTLSNVYYSPINFTANPSLRVKLRFTEQLHCPVCGVETISEKKFEEIKQTKCETVEDLVNLLEENEKYISDNMSGAVEKIKNFAIKRPDMPTHIALNLIQKNLGFHENIEFRKLRDSVKKFTYDHKFSEQDREKAKNITLNLKAYLNNEISYNEAKENIVGAINSIEHPDKNLLFNDVNKTLKKIMLERFCFHAKAASSLTPEECVETFLSKLFTNSIREFHVLKSEGAKFDGEPVAVCKGCQLTKSTIVDWTLPPEKSAENLVRYFEDIYNSRYFDNQLKNHVIKVRYAAEVITKNNVNLSKLTSPEFEDIKNEIFNSEAIYAKFDLASEEGIPCAGCNTITVPYEQKMRIREEIANAKDIHELQAIIHKYPQHIKDLFKKVFQCFDIILEHFPDISEDLMHASLLDIYNNKLSNSFQKIEDLALEKIEDPRTSYYDEGIYREYLSQVGDKYKNIQEIISVDEYFKIFNDTIANINNLEDKSKIFTIKEEIWENSMLQSFLNPPEEYARNRESRLRDVINYTFARASSSVDHMDAKSKGGSHDESNLMILCNDCNKHKKDKAFSYWAGKESAAAKNLQNYVNEIDKIIKERKLEKYYTYAPKFVTHVRELTKGRISLTTPNKNNK